MNRYQASISFEVEAEDDDSAELIVERLTEHVRCENGVVYETAEYGGISEAPDPADRIRRNTEILEWLQGKQ